MTGMGESAPPGDEKTAQMQPVDEGGTARPASESPSTTGVKEEDEVVFVCHTRDDDLDSLESLPYTPPCEAEDEATPPAAAAPAAVVPEAPVAQLRSVIFAIAPPSARRRRNGVKASAGDAVNSAPSTAQAQAQTRTAPAPAATQSTTAMAPSTRIVDPISAAARPLASQRDAAVAPVHRRPHAAPSKPAIAAVQRRNAPPTLKPATAAAASRAQPATAHNASAATPSARAAALVPPPAPAQAQPQPNRAMLAKPVSAADVRSALVSLVEKASSPPPPTSKPPARGTQQATAPGNAKAIFENGRTLFPSSALRRSAVPLPTRVVVTASNLHVSRPPSSSSAPASVPKQSSNRSEARPAAPSRPSSADLNPPPPAPSRRVSASSQPIPVARPPTSAPAQRASVPLSSKPTTHNAPTGRAATPAVDPPNCTSTPARATPSKVGGRPTAHSSHPSRAYISSTPSRQAAPAPRLPTNTEKRDGANARKSALSSVPSTVSRGRASQSSRSSATAASETAPGHPGATVRVSVTASKQRASVPAATPPQPAPSVTPIIDLTEDDPPPLMRDTTPAAAATGAPEDPEARNKIAAEERFNQVQKKAVHYVVWLSAATQRAVSDPMSVTAADVRELTAIDEWALRNASHLKSRTRDSLARALHEAKARVDMHPTKRPGGLPSRPPAQNGSVSRPPPARRGYTARPPAVQSSVPQFEPLPAVPRRSHSTPHIGPKRNRQEQHALRRLDSSRHDERPTARNAAASPPAARGKKRGRPPANGAPVFKDNADRQRFRQFVEAQNASFRAGAVADLHNAEPPVVEYAGAKPFLMNRTRPRGQIAAGPGTALRDPVQSRNAPPGQRDVTRGSHLARAPHADADASAGEPAPKRRATTATARRNSKFGRKMNRIFKERRRHGR